MFRKVGEYIDQLIRIKYPDMYL